LIRRLFLKDFISFDRVELEFQNGLVVFSGASGSGKSLLISAILYAFGYCSVDAKLVELNIDRPKGLESESYEFDDELILKVIKRDKIRYYLDGQSIPKRVLNGLFSPYVKYLSVRDKLLFSSRELLELLDSYIIAKNKDYNRLLIEYSGRYENYKLKLKELEKIRADEIRLNELVEFAKFEIEKIEAIEPKVGEDIELLKIKQHLSRLDKIESLLREVQGIFEYEGLISEIYRLLDKDDSFFLEAMERLRGDFEDVQLLFEELSEIDIEYVLDRLEKLSYLKNRYGGIAEALNYVKRKKEELLEYQNIEQNRSILESFISTERNQLLDLAREISKFRKDFSLKLEKELLEYLFELKLPAVKFIFDTISIDEFGLDRLDISLEGSTIDTLSGGEFNRIRLALMVASFSSFKNGGILILDEIDANVSGDESIAIANMISKLSCAFQIFAISHQAHLASKANQHILITKENSTSFAKVLNRADRINEIARIIGGERPNKEALDFARRLLDM
jgi:DNA repair protein RecN (Recombination protein N)